MRCEMRGLGLIGRVQFLRKYLVEDSRSFILRSRWFSLRPRISSAVTLRHASHASAGHHLWKRQFKNQPIRLFRVSTVLNEDAIITVPPFAESVSEGDIRWNKNVGDTVLVDEIVCEIETDKTSMPVPSPVAGVIVKRFVEDGATVKAGQQIFIVKIDPSVQGQAAPKKSKPTTPTPAPSPKPSPVEPAPVSTKSSPAPTKPAPAPTKPAPAPAKPSPAPPKPPPETPKPAQPPAPKVAGVVDKPEPPPTERKPSRTPPTLPPVTVATTVTVPPIDPTKEIYGTRTEHRVKMSRIRQRIATRLKEAQNVNAMLTTFNEIDMSTIIAFRKTHQEAFSKKYGFKLGFMSAFLKASAYALQDQPTVNAVISDNDIIYRDYIDISVAVATPKGLVVPVVRNVQSLNFADIERVINELAVKARDGKLAVEDMDGGTFTVSNGGVYGSLLGTPIINPPQSAILGMHATVERPVVVKGQIVIRPMMYVALTYDHRLIDGREAVLFLRKIKAAVEDPSIIVAGL